MSADPRQDALTLVTLKGVGVHRSGRWIVRGVDLVLRKGEVVTLIGPNGSGKSTTAKVATGVLRPDEGSVQRAAGLTLGYVPQRLAIDRTLPLTVARLMTLTGQRPASDIDDALDSAGVAHLRTAEVQTLSGGEFQRVLLARALARKPDLLVLDEPLQGVDFQGETQLYDLIRGVRDRTGCGVLLISHDLHVVMAGTDTVICLNGHVCCSGTPEAVASSPEYLDLFGARAAGSLAIYRHHHDHTHLPDGRVRHADGSITDHCRADDGHHAPPSTEGRHDHDHGHDHAHDDGHSRHATGGNG